MIEGKTLLQMSKPYPSVPGGPSVGVYEHEHLRCHFKQYLPADVLPNGTVRTRDLIQFWTDPGGLRTVAADDIVNISNPRRKSK